MTSSTTRRVRVVDVEPVADRIKRFRFVDVSGKKLPAFSGGSHVVVTMRGPDGHIWRNPYSLMGSPGDVSSYQISVCRAVDSRGGSDYMHDNVRAGSELEVTNPINLFPIARQARKHLLIAGGIGITPFMSMMHELAAANANFELHYKVRSTTRGAFCNDLVRQYGSRVHIYRSDAGHTLPLGTLLRDQPVGTHLYVCGPQAMIDWALQSGRAAGWPHENLHAEHFSAPRPGRPFSVKLARSKCEIQVGPQQSILEALEQNGIDAPSLCRGGACGQCETRVLARDGALQHNDHYLTEDEKLSNEKIMICVSRTAGDCLTLDL